MLLTHPQSYIARFLCFVSCQTAAEVSFLFFFFPLELHGRDLTCEEHRTTLFSIMT